MNCILNVSQFRAILCILLSAFLIACSSSGSPDASNTSITDDATTSAEAGNTTSAATTVGDATSGAGTGGVDTNADAESIDGGSAGDQCITSARLSTEDIPYVGNLFRPSTPSDERFHSLWNQVTPENAGKWFNVEARRDEMSWEALDAAVSFSSDFNYDFKFHTLVVGGNEPAWMESLSVEEQEQEIVEWFDEVSARYPDIRQIEVVSEPVSDQPFYKDALGGDGNTGWDWVIRAFELARARFPDSELILNDYKVSDTDETGPAFLALVALLQERNLVDGVGVEGHFLEKVELATIETKLSELVAMNLPVYLSDLDINEPDDQRQLDTMKAIFPVFFENAAVKGLTLWGYRENQLWREDAFLLSSTETDRPALDWLECFLGLDRGN